MAKKYIDIRKLPETMYNDAVKVREVVKYKLLDSAAKRELKASIPSYDGVGDVVLYSNNQILGFTNRLNLVNNYVRVRDGGRIKITGLHYNKMYIAMRSSNEPYKVLKIPKGAKYGVTINGHNIDGSCFILLRVVNGQVDINRPQVIKGMDAVYEFRTQFSITSLANYSKAKGRTYELKQIKKIQSERTDLANKKIWSPKDANKIVDDLVKAPYVATYRIMAKNLRTGKYVPYGFILRDTRINNDVENTKFNVKTDVAKKLSDIKQLCTEKQIRNITVATMTETSKIYFRGVGIKIENLPQVDAKKVMMAIANAKSQGIIK